MWGRQWRLGSAWSHWSLHYVTAPDQLARYLHNLPGDLTYVDTLARHRNVGVIQHSVLFLRRVGLLLLHSTDSTLYTSQGTVQTVRL